MVTWVCLQFVIVVFPDHTHLLFLTVGVLSLRYLVVCTVESLSLLYLVFYLDLYVLGSFMQTKHLCVLIHIGIKGEVVTVKPV